MIEFRGQSKHDNWYKNESYLLNYKQLKSVLLNYKQSKLKRNR